MLINVHNQWMLRWYSQIKYVTCCLQILMSLLNNCITSVTPKEITCGYNRNRNIETNFDQNSAMGMLHCFMFNLPWKILKMFFCICFGYGLSDKPSLSWTLFQKTQFSMNKTFHVRHCSSHLALNSGQK